MQNEACVPAYTNTHRTVCMYEQVQTSSVRKSDEGNNTTEGFRAEEAIVYDLHDQSRVVMYFLCKKPPKAERFAYIYIYTIRAYKAKSLTWSAQWKGCFTTTQAISESGTLGYSTYPEVKTDFTPQRQKDYKEHIHVSYLYKRINGVMNNTTSKPEGEKAVFFSVCKSPY